MFFSNSIANKKGFLHRPALFRAWTGGAGAGAYNTPGVPEIHGQLGNGSLDQNGELGIYYDGSLTGAFAKAGSVRATYPAAEKNNKPGDRYYLADLLGSRCNSVFGSSATVMPASVNLPACIYLGIPV